MADYNKLFEDFQRDPVAFSKDPEKVKQFMEGYKMVTSGKAPDGYKSPSDFAALYDSMQKWAMSTPTGKQAVTDMVRNSQTERFVKRNKPFFDAILAGADLATSISQIRQSNKAVRELQRPTLPSPNVLDPQLNNAIAQAQRGSFEALRALEPAKQEIAQQRLADVNTGRSLSGGQAGAFGAYSTAASLRAQRAAQRLPQIGDTIRARQQQRADQLLGVRQGVLQQEFGNRMQIANANMNQYQLDAAAAAALGQAGRTNLRNTLGQLPEMLTRTAGNMLPVQDVWDAYGSQVQNNLVNSITNANRVKAIQPPLQSSTPPINGSVPVQLNNAMTMPSWSTAPLSAASRYVPSETMARNMGPTGGYRDVDYFAKAGFMPSRAADRAVLQDPRTSNTAQRRRALQRFYSNNY